MSEVLGLIPAFQSSIENGLEMSSVVEMVKAVGLRLLVLALFAELFLYSSWCPTFIPVISKLIAECKLTNRNNQKRG